MPEENKKEMNELIQGGAAAPEISGRTKLLALIGSPVGHSLSPAMHNLACRLLGLDYRYLAFDVTADRTAQALDAMRTLGIRGFNITMPCKTAAAGLADELSPAARLTGACNTIVNEDGRLIGYTTDGEGFVGDLRSRGIDVRGKKITIAGAGGAATAIQVQCALDGAEAISIFNRTLRKARETADRIREACPRCDIRAFDISDTARMTQEIRESDIFSNATSIGMAPNTDDTPVKDTAAFRPGLVVHDAVYNPLRTRLMREAETAGCTVLGGRGMLLYQGAAAFRLFTGCEMPVEAVISSLFGDSKAAK